MKAFKNEKVFNKNTFFITRGQELSFTFSEMVNRKVNHYRELVQAACISFYFIGITIDGVVKATDARSKATLAPGHPNTLVDVASS